MNPLYPKVVDSNYIKVKFLRIGITKATYSPGIWVRTGLMLAFVPLVLLYFIEEIKKVVKAKKQTENDIQISQFNYTYQF